jgi:hypothetical protein
MPSQGEARCSDVTSIPHVSEARCDTFHRKDNTDKKCRDRKDEREVGPALGTGSWTHTVHRGANWHRGISVTPLLNDSKVERGRLPVQMVEVSAHRQVEYGGGNLARERCGALDST